MAEGTLVKIFLSTPSARRATYVSYTKISPHRFLSTPSARRATDAKDHMMGELEISIHALREEGDARKCSLRAGI